MTTTTDRPSDAMVMAALRRASQAIQACRLAAHRLGVNPGTLHSVELECAVLANALQNAWDHDAEMATLDRLGVPLRPEWERTAQTILAKLRAERPEETGNTPEYDPTWPSSHPAFMGLDDYPDTTP